MKERQVGIAQNEWKVESRACQGMKTRSTDSIPAKAIFKLDES